MCTMTKSKQQQFPLRSTFATFSKRFRNKDKYKRYSRHVYFQLEGNTPIFYKIILFSLVVILITMIHVFIADLGNRIFFYVKFVLSMSVGLLTKWCFDFWWCFVYYMKHYIQNEIYEIKYSKFLYKKMKCTYCFYVFSLWLLLQNFWIHFLKILLIKVSG